MIEKRRSKIQGWGVYATQTISKNTRIVDYAGEKISNQVSLKREARYINHSCRPNCYIHIVGGIIWIRAARKIRKGEELTYNYNTDGEGLIKCRCRPGCQHLI